MIFAAKEAVEKRAMEKGRKAGLQEGLQAGLQEGEQAERERLRQGLDALRKDGVDIPPEVARLIERETGLDSRP